MNEPDNHTAVVDRFGDTWVRVDEHPGRWGTWWPLCTGPGSPPSAWLWEPDDIGTPRRWEDITEAGPFTVADQERAAAALACVREEAS